MSDGAGSGGKEPVGAMSGGERSGGAELVERGLMVWGSKERGPVEQGSMEWSLLERGPVERVRLSGVFIVERVPVEPFTCFRCQSEVEIRFIICRK